MSLSHSPKIVTDGLVFAYDMANEKKSWKGAPVTNQFTLPTGDTNGFGVENDTFTRIRSGNYGGYRIKPNDYVWKFNFSGSNACPYHGWDIPTTAGTVVTFSFDYYVDMSTTGYPSTNHLANMENAGSGTSGSIGDPTPSIIGVWKRAYFSSTATATGNSRCLLYPGGCLTRLADSGFILYKNPQVEFNAPGSIPTPFVAGTRSNTQAIVDLTGNTTITASSLTYNSDGSFSFNGSSDSLYITNSLSAFTNLTISTWFYLTTANGTQDIIVDRNVSLRFQLNNNKLSIHFGNGSSWVFTTDIGSTTLSANKWYNAVWTYNQNESVLYLNGNVENSYTHANGGNTGTGGIYIGQYAGGSGYNFPGKINAVSIYNRALSASEVRQNFDAVKERYFGFQDLTFITTAGTITYTNNGTKSVTFYKSGGTNTSWNTGAYCGTAFTAPCTIEYTKNAASSDNSLSYAMIGWNEDPTTNSSYNTIDYAAYPYRTSTFRIYHNGSNLGDFGSGWDPNKRLYIVYDTDGYIRHYNGDILIASFNYGTGKTVYIDTGLYKINSTYGGFTDVRACQKSWNGYQYV